MIKPILLFLILLFANAHSTSEDTLSTYSVDQNWTHAANFGAHFVTQRAIEDGAITAGDYKIDAIYQDVNIFLPDVISTYELDVRLKAENGASFRASYIVDVYYEKGFQKIRSYSYAVNEDLDDVIFGFEHAEEVVLFSESGEWYDRHITIVEAPLLEYTEEDWTIEGNDVYAQEEEDILTVTEFDHDSNGQYLLIYGVNYVLGKISDDPKNTFLQGSSNSQFHLTRILYVRHYIGTDTFLPDGGNEDANIGIPGTGYYYKFDVEVENKQGVRLRIKIIFNYNHGPMGLFPTEISSYDFKRIM